MGNKLQVAVLGVILAVGGCADEKTTIRPDAKRVKRVLLPEEVYNQGIEALHAKRDEKALRLFRQALAMNKKRKQPTPMVDAHYNLGALWLRQKMPQEACVSFRKVLSLNKKHRQALLGIGVCLKQQKKFKQAIQHYRRALKLVPRDPEIMNNLIVVYRLNRQYRDAEKTGYKLLARAPNNVEAYKNMTLIYYDQKKYEMAELLCIQAGKMLEKQRKKDEKIPPDAGIYNNLGMIYMGMKKYRDALSQFSEALEIEPEYVDALINLGSMAHRFRDYRRALRAYGKVVEKQPDNLIAKSGLAYAYYGMGDAKKAIVFFSDLLKARPNDSDILYKMGEIFNSQLRDYRQALSFYEKYKKAQGSRLDQNDPVHNRIQTTQAKLEMAEQLVEEQQEQERRQRVREEKKQKTLKEAKNLDKTGLSETTKKLDDLIQVNDQHTNDTKNESSKAPVPAKEKDEKATALDKKNKAPRSQGNKPNPKGKR